MKDKSNTLSNNIHSSESLIKYLQEKGENHNHYKYYAKIDRIKAIKDNKVLYLSCGKTWNDIRDRENFSKANGIYMNFGKCFSTALLENVAMWMLYGGIHGDGGMIEFTQSDIKAIKNKTQEITLGYFIDGDFQPLRTVSKEDFRIFITDMVYIHEDANSFRLTRADENRSGVKRSIVAEIAPYTKSFPWHYEKESRLVCQVCKDKIPDGCTDLRIDLAEVCALGFLDRIVTSPIYKGDKINGISESQMASQIEWDL